MTVNERVNAERLVVLGWGRAILLQLAHPLVAAGVADHSTFRSGPFARVRRLHATIGAMRALTFGTAPEVTDAVNGINAIHDRVHGTLHETVGPFPAGTPYSAHDPDLLRWVDATLRDSLPRAYALFVAPLSSDERDRYCAEGDEVMERLGIPVRSRPATEAALQAYMRQMIEGGTIAVGRTARELGREVVAPPFWRLLWPAGRINRLATIGLLPPGIREAYGLPWTGDDQRALDGWARRIRRWRRHAPDALALWPGSREQGGSGPQPSDAGAHGARQPDDGPES